MLLIQPWYTRATIRLRSGVGHAVAYSGRRWIRPRTLSPKRFPLLCHLRRAVPGLDQKLQRGVVDNDAHRSISFMRNRWCSRLPEELVRGTARRGFLECFVDCRFAGEG